jgi:hypothetical protein
MALIALGTLLTAAAAMGAMARRQHCLVGRGEKILVRAPSGLVSERVRFSGKPNVEGERASKATYYACLRRSGRRITVGQSSFFPYGNGSDLQSFRLRGRYLTFVYSETHRYQGTVLDSVRQYDLVTGRRTLTVTYMGPTISPTNPNSDTAHPDLVANESGDAAWAVNSANNCPWQAPCPGEAVIVYDRQGVSTVFAGPAGPGPASRPNLHPIADLRITATTVLWQGEEGTSFSAALP